MTTESGKGTLKNETTETELVLMVRPVSYSISKDFNYDVKSILAKSIPIVAYKNSAPAVLSLELDFHKDAATGKFDSQKVHNFAKGFHKIDPETKSVPVISFQIGGFEFSGYVDKYNCSFTKLSVEGEPQQLKLDLTILSNGKFEQE